MTRKEMTEADKINQLKDELRQTKELNKGMAAKIAKLGKLNQDAWERYQKTEKELEEYKNLMKVLLND